VQGGALSCATTPRPKTAEEALAFASPERFAAYDGTSASMLDHYYDKLLAIARPPPELVRNRFLEGAAHASAAPLLQVCQVHTLHALFAVRAPDAVCVQCMSPRTSR
jgi:hypothetical protein